jgi:hypothetical protein
MSSTDVELIPSVLSTTAGISRTSSAPSLLLTTIADAPQTEEETDAGAFEDVELATSLDGIDAEGVEAWSKLYGMCIVGVQDGMITLARSDGHMWPTYDGILTMP